MEIEIYKYQNELLITANGRLDSSWSDFFKERVLTQIRAGAHSIIIDAAKIKFLSSVGIGALAVLYKELLAVNGSFKIVNTAGMVKNTLVASRLDMWLSDDIINWELISDSSSKKDEDEEFEKYELNKDASVSAEIVNAWQPWDAVKQSECKSIKFEKDILAFGIGAIGDNYKETKDHFGEFAGVAGEVAYQPPNEKGRTDFLLSEHEFVPTLNTIHAIVCKGEFSKLLRFNPKDSLDSYKLSYLIQKMLDNTDSDSTAFCIIGEIEGVVGCSTINSPGKISERLNMEYPEIKSWLSFCGERAHSREMALITGVASSNGVSAQLKPINVDRNISAHMHSVVYPFQFLQNGKIELTNTVEKLFTGSPPKAVYHLINDNRTSNGIGESEFYSAACWFSPINNKEIFE